MSSDASESSTLIEAKPLALIVSKRATIFFFVVSVLLLILWCVGSFQDFLDVTQIMLLGLLRLSSSLLILSSALGLALSLVLAMRKRFKARFGAMIAYLLGLGFATLAIALADLLIRLESGIGA